MGARQRAAICLLACLPVGPATTRAGEWCDVPFKDAAHGAATVVLVRVERVTSGALEVATVEVLKGHPDPPLPRLDRGYPVKGGDHLLLALDGAGRLLREGGGLGLCTPISVLAIRGRRLRAHDRAGYDGRSAALPLDALLVELRALAAAAPLVHAE